MNSKKTQWWIFANPHSGGFNARRLNELNSCLYQQGVVAAVRLPASQDQLVSQVQELWSQGERNFIVAAGDGTASVLINALQDFSDCSSAKVAIFPMGSGNDTARSLGKHRYRHREITGWASGIKLGRFRQIPLLKITTEYETRHALNIWGVGLDAQVLQARRSGSYLLSLLKVLAKASPVTVVDQGTRTDLYALLCANGRYAGGGMVFARNAKISVSDMHIFKLAKTSLWSLIPWIPALYRGNIDGHPKVAIEKTDKFEFALTEPSIWQCDGELRRASKEFSCELKQNAVWVYFPESD